MARVREKNAHYTTPQRQPPRIVHLIKYIIRPQNDGYVNTRMTY
jgi:hypothetical protein